MADLASSKNKINDLEVAQNAPHSEALMEKLGANINYLIDTTDSNDSRLDAIEGDTPTKTISSSSGNWSTTSMTYGDVTNLSASITVSAGSDVEIFLIPDGSSNVSSIKSSNDVSSNEAQGTMRVLRDASAIGEVLVGEVNAPGVLRFYDSNPGAGTYTYKLQAKYNPTGGGPSYSVEVNYVKLLVREIKS